MLAHFFLWHQKIRLGKKSTIAGVFRFRCPLCAVQHTAVKSDTNLSRCFHCSKNFTVALHEIHISQYFRSLESGIDTLPVYSGAFHRHQLNGVISLESL
jgi:hypothetical protein